jgi:ATP-dependent protease HslVU (ClpYQ) peptidase subunit
MSSTDKQGLQGPLSTPHTSLGTYHGTTIVAYAAAASSRSAVTDRHPRQHRRQGPARRRKLYREKGRPRGRHADAPTLFERFEAAREAPGLPGARGHRLTKDWRTDRVPGRPEAAAVADGGLLIITGNGVLELEYGILPSARRRVCPGGASPARTHRSRPADRRSRSGSRPICIYTNHNHTIGRSTGAGPHLARSRARAPHPSMHTVP